MGKRVINFTYYIKENYFYMTKIATRDTELEKTSCNSYHRQNLIQWKQLSQIDTQRVATQYKIGQRLWAFVILHKGNSRGLP